MELDLGQQSQLLQLARAAIAAGLEKSADSPAKICGPALSRIQGGAFVSLHKGGKLRGCIGSFAGSAPLPDTVWQMAKAAAFEDPRFKPLQKEELAELKVEISVLSPLRKSSPQEVEAGKHGIFIISPRGRGVLLPQVAAEYGWERETFLQHTCVKAGLPKDAWKDADVEVYLFTAQIFAENFLKP
jgi:AmmeMemoRadiSam system protein A